MTPTILGIIGFGALLALILIGVPIGVAGFLVGITGIVILRGLPSLGIIGIAYLDTTLAYSLSVIPLFIIMGSFATNAGIADNAFGAARKWVGHFRGGLVAATSLGGAFFGACTGSSTATVGMLGKMIPAPMKEAGYDNKIIAGSVTSIGCLSATIPPSTLLVVYGIFTETPVNKMLMAGILPGILNAVIFMILAFFLGWVRPNLMPASPRLSWGARLRAIPDMWGIVLIAAALVGGIYSGIFTPTEAGAVGTAVALALAIISRCPRNRLVDALVEGGKLSCKIFFIIAGMILFAKFIALSGLSTLICNWIVGLELPFPLFMFALIVFYLILGMFLEGMGILALTMPIIFPTIMAMGLDPVWFGIIVCILIEIGFITPPVGLNLFVAKSVMPETPLADIIQGIIPFFIGFLITLAILVAFPQISLVIPGMMGR